MITRTTLGSSGLTVSAMGLGCMGMSESYGAADWDGGLATIDRALELGITFLDTADAYGTGHNEVLVGRAIHGRRDQVQLATKFGIDRSAGDRARRIRGARDYVLRSCDASLLRLGVEVIDLYYAHRPPQDVEIEETVGAMAELVEAGKVRRLGLSEVDGELLRRAHAVHPIAAVQSEYSLWTRDVEAVTPVMAELAVGLVPYSPLGRGFLTGALDRSTLGEKDFRRTNPVSPARRGGQREDRADRVRGGRPAGCHPGPGGAGLGVRPGRAARGGGGGHSGHPQPGPARTERGRAGAHPGRRGAGRAGPAERPGDGRALHPRAHRRGRPGLAVTHAWRHAHPCNGAVAIGPGEADANTIDPEGTVLITGGTGTNGGMLAKHLVSAFVRGLVASVLGHSTVDEFGHSTVDEFGDTASFRELGSTPGFGRPAQPAQRTDRIAVPGDAGFRPAHGGTGPELICFPSVGALSGPPDYFRFADAKSPRSCPTVRAAETAAIVTEWIDGLPFLRF